MVCPLKTDPMSGAGTLQQRTTYLISLTLVKVEAVGEHGGEQTKGNTQERGERAGEGAEAGPGAQAVAGSGSGSASGSVSGSECGAGAGAGARAGSGDGVGAGARAGSADGAGARAGSGDGSGARAGSGDGSGARAGSGDGAGASAGSGAGVGDGARAGTGVGAGARAEVEVDQVKLPSKPDNHGDAAILDVGKCNEIKEGERKYPSPLKDTATRVGSVTTKGNEKLSDYDNVLISSTGDSGRTQKLKFQEDAGERDKIMVVTSEGAQCTEAPPTPTSSSEVVVERNRTPTRSSIPVRGTAQRPVTLLKAHSMAVSRREARERSPTTAQSLDRKDSRVPTRSPGPCRASWAESEGQSRARSEARGRTAKQEVGGGRAVAPDYPRADRMTTGSASLPGPVSLVHKPPRKGTKSRTLDNSDLNSLSEDLFLGRESQTHTTQQGQGQRASAKDRKMLKFISGIFTKSSSASASSSSSTAPPVYSIGRESSEEEVACANSQEWTLSRSIPELRVGVLGSIRSCKSALVNRYITGSYLPQEKQEGGRYKKEVLVDGQSQLLLIREETGPPDAQFSSWVDAVILVFSLENETSFQEVYQLFSQLNTHRSTADLPLIVVGSQDKISSTNPRVIEDLRARQLCVDVRHSVFYETCATYGLNVDRVFAEASQRIVTQRKQSALLASCKSLPNSPSHSGGSTPGSASFPGQASNGGHSSDYPSSLPSTPVVSHRELRGGAGGGEGGGSVTTGSLRNVPHRRPSLFKNRRGSDCEKRGVDPKGDVASVRPTPIKQSILWKRSGSSLNKEWKKKCVTLSNNGTLSYHSSINDYKQGAHGKEIDLLRVTVKVPGKRPPRAVTPAGPAPGPAPGLNGVATEPASTAASLLSPSILSVDERTVAVSPQGDRGVQRCPSSLSNKTHSVDAIEGVTKDQGQSSPMIDRKKNRKKKSMSQKGDATIGQAEAKRKMWKLKSFGSLRNINKTEEENADFIIVSSSGQTWHFEAPSMEDRDAWVQAIESQILASLQSCASGRNKARRSSQSEAVALQGIRNAKGNNLCVDCEALTPTWASLNLGALICIECSGIHRNLGTHLSRVRSLDLDDWPRELTQVLAAIGNHMANSIWESCTQGRHKPTANSTREERESWIRAKYEQRVFVAPLPSPGKGTVGAASVCVRLLSAVTERDLPQLLLLLAHSTKEQINGSPTPAGAPSQSRSALHAACQLGDVVMTQLLVWYGSDVRARDPQGLTALTLARKTGSKECADILLQHGCPNEVSPTCATPSLSRRSSTASLGGSNSRRGVS